jgi:hypothetical protein
MRRGSLPVTNPSWNSRTSWHHRARLQGRATAGRDEAPQLVASLLGPKAAPGAPVHHAGGQAEVPLDLGQRRGPESPAAVATGLVTFGLPLRTGIPSGPPALR